jgi:hypothetical protein
MVMLFNPLISNAFSPISRNTEPASNVTETSALFKWKASSPITQPMLE